MHTLRGLWAFLLLTAASHGQADRGALTGTVSDPSGLGVPDVSVAASQNGTGLKRFSVTSSSAAYDIPRPAACSGSQGNMPGAPNASTPAKVEGASKGDVAWVEVTS